MVKIKINNEEKETDSKNLMQLSAELQLPERGIAIAVNNRVAPRTEWESTAINEGDNVTVIKAAFGG